MQFKRSILVFAVGERKFFSIFAALRGSLVNGQLSLLVFTIDK